MNSVPTCANRSTAFGPTAAALAVGALMRAPACAGGAIEELGFFPLASNRDGTRAVGSSFDGERLRAWSPSKGVAELPLPPGAIASYLYRELPHDRVIGEDGEFIVGTAEFPVPGGASEVRAVRWGGPAPAVLPVPPGLSNSLGVGISRDGQTVMGQAFNTEGIADRGFTWNAGLLRVLQGPTGYPTTYLRSSDDTCAVLGGFAERLWDDPDGADGATTVGVRWIDGAPMPIGTPQQLRNSAITELSSDGLVAAVSAWHGLPAWKSQPFRWCDERFIAIDVPTPFDSGVARRISADGSTIIGRFLRSDPNGDDTFVAFRWTELSGTTLLGTMTQVNTVSANGAIVLGRDAVGTPMIWTPGVPAQPLQQYLAALGLPLGDRTILESGGNRDGTVLGGALLRADGSITGYRIAELALPGTLSPPAPSHVRASDGTDSAGVVVSWEPSVRADGYSVLRSPITGGQWAAIGSVGRVTSFLDAATVAGVRHRYAVLAIGNAGASGIGASDTGYRAVTPCVGDINADGAVDGFDLGIVLGSWGTPAADLTGDGTTNGFDLGILLGRWGRCEP
jgi:uncharacterized membrane protein